MKKTILLFALLMTLMSMGAVRGQAFVTTWKTDNPGASEDNQVTLPLSGSGYNFDIDWGDGNTETGLTNAVETTHTYAAPGTYTISITGDFPRLFFNNTGDKNKILTIEQWGSITWTSMAGAFHGCANLDIPAADAPDLSIVTTMSTMFAGCTSLSADLNHWDVSNVERMNIAFSATNYNGNIADWDVSNVFTMRQMFIGSTFNGDISGWDMTGVTDASDMFANNDFFNQDISGWNTGSFQNTGGMFIRATAFNQDLSRWDVSNVTFMRSMFFEASAFDQNLGDWDVSGVTNMEFMFNNSGLSSRNYDQTLMGWSQQMLTSNITLGAENVEYCQASVRQSIIDEFNWTFDGDSPATVCPFITTWKTDNAGTSNDNQITVPATTTNSPNFDIDWGDGTNDTGLTGPSTHTYAEPGTYTVSITGDFTGVSFSNTGDKDKLLTVEQWGNIDTWKTLGFWGCSNLQITAADAPDLSSVTSLSAAFRDCSSLNSDIGHWNTSTILSLQNTFRGATSFNQDIGDWDVSNVNDMRETFRSAEAFNQDLNNWNVSKVTSMFYTFAFATDFNGAIEDWDVSMVSDMSNMFNGTSFNQPIGGWNVAGVSSFLAMFSNSAFNQDIGNWDVSGTSTFNRMFQNSAFNQDIGSWNMSNAVGLASMFQNAAHFNQDLSGWSFPNVISIGQMFEGASAFNQDLSGWDVSQIGFMFNIFDNTDLSKANYDNMLTSWSQQSLQNDVELGALGIEYCLGGTARQSIIDTYNWTFVGDSENCIVDIPDANLKAALLSNAAINTVDDGEITIQEAAAFSGVLELINLGIADATGLEAFVNLDELNISINSLTSLDVSANTELTSLRIGANAITEIDLSKNTKLEDFIASGCPISTIDLSSNPALRTLTLTDNLIASLDLSANGSLTGVFVVNQPNLVSIDLRNSDNEEITDIDLSNNPALTCVSVDDRVLARTNWTAVDDLDVYKFTCDPEDIVNIPDANLKAALLANTAINIIDDGEITAGEAEAYTGAIVATGSNIADANGLQYFYNIITLTLLSNNLTAIDIRNNTDLSFVSLSANQLGFLDVTHNTRLTGLFANGNLLGTIDLSNNTLLDDLLLGGNNLSSLDVSNLPLLERLLVENNELTSLDLRNGNNELLTTFDARGNVALSCISVDDPVFAAENWTDIEPGTSFNFSCDPNEIVNIPDPNFKAGLLSDASINTTDDGEITYGEAEAFTGTMDVANLGIEDLTGIEAFANVTQLDINSNALTEIDLSFNVSLTHLFAYSNDLTSIDLSNNTAITNLNLTNNDLGTLDLSALPDLFTLQCQFCELTALDVSTNANIQFLIVSENSIASIDLSNNTALHTLNIQFNELTSLDLSSNTALQSLSAFGNNISSIDLSNNIGISSVSLSNNPLTSLDVSANTALTLLSVSNCAISELDLSANSALARLFALNNGLTSLNVANGNNSNVTDFNITGNPNLTCVTVDDVNFATANFTDIDAGTSFSTNCENTETDFLSFSFVEETGPAAIDTENHTIESEVLLGSNLSMLAPTFALSSGATVDVTSGVAQDFTSPLTLTVTAENPTAVQEWTITVREENAVPTDIALAPAAIAENSAVGTSVGTLSTADANSISSHTYTLVAGAGDEDNSLFSIDGDALLAEASFDFEVRSLYSVRVETNDGNGGTFQKALEVSVTNVNEGITLVNAIDDQSLEQDFATLNIAIGDVFEDADGDALTFEVVSSEVNVVTAAISGTNIVLTEVGVGTATITVTASDGNGESASDEFVVEVSSPPLGLEDLVAIQVYPNPVVSNITVRASEPVSVRLTDLQGKVMHALKGMEVKVPMQDAKAGTYLLLIEKGSERLARRIIKTN